MDQINIFTEDECCAPHIMATSLIGKLDGVEEWVCPVCGCVWRPAAKVSNIWHWAPICEVVVF